jgi:hypothetical protein
MRPLNWVVAPCYFLLTALLAFNVPACAAVVTTLPAIIAAVVDGALVLDTIASFIRRYFAAHPDPSNQDKLLKVEIAIARARAALDAALRIAQGAEKLNQAKIDEAFADFRMAYQELLILVQPFGISSGGDKLAATPGGLKVPEPMALTLKVK